MPKEQQTKKLLTVFIDLELLKQLKFIADAHETGVSQLVEKWLYMQYEAYVDELNEWMTATNTAEEDLMV